GTPVRGEDEWNKKLGVSRVDATAGNRFGTAIEAETSRITLGLVNVGRDVPVPRLGFYHADATSADEERIVSRAARGGPLGDGHGAASRRARAGGVAQSL